MIVDIEKWIPGGDCLARVDGKVIFIEGGIPGEKVRLEITQSKKDFSKAKVVEILKASPHRVQAPCQHFDKCGGCVLQHISYEHQVVLKEQMLVETLERMGSLQIKDKIPFFTSPEYKYRNRVRFHQKGKHKGFKEKSGNRIVSLQECPVLTSHGWEALDKHHSKQSEVSFFDTLQNVVEKGEFEAVVCEKSFVLDNRVFFQSNLLALPSLVNWVLEGEKGAYAMDLFSGVGFFASFLEDSFEDVVAVERDKRCLHFAKKNLRKTAFFTGAVEDWSQENQQQKPIDYLIVDPPREGLHADTPQILASWDIRKMCYVSCNPVTLARDLKKLIALGFVVEDLAGFDFYPQTHHLEVAVKLRKNIS